MNAGVNVIRVTVWNENWHEQHEAEVSQRYPEGIHGAIAAALSTDPRFEVRTATLNEPSCGLSQEILHATDVLLWWGHRKHHEVPDDVAQWVHERVLAGMGFIALHSAHFSKPFKALMGTHCSLRWRNTGERERVWNIAPSHPIAAGVPEHFVLERSEMYGERFDIPEPDQTLFLSWFAGGEVFRSGCTWNRGHGRVFFFSPGDQAFPIYRDVNVLRVITNAAAWCAASVDIPFSCPAVEPLEPIDSPQGQG